MIVSSHSTGGDAKPQSHDLRHAGSFLTISQCASYLNCSQSQVRLLCDNGDLECYRTIGGHRRVKTDSVSLYANGETLAESRSLDGTTVGRGIAAYVRCSSKKQNIQGQREYVLEKVREIEGVGADEIAIYQEVCSAMSHRAVLNRMMLDCIAGKITKIYCRWTCRLFRSEAQAYLIRDICSEFGCQIIALDKGDDVDDRTEFTAEILRLVTIWGNRASAKKSAEVCARTFSDETIQEIIRLRKEGRTIKATLQWLQDHNHLTEQQTPIRMAKLRVWLCENEKTLMEATGGKFNPVEEWLTKRVHKMKKYKPKTNRLTSKELYQLYQKETGDELTQYLFGRTLTQWAGVERRCTLRKEFAYAGLKMKPHKPV